MHWSFFSNFVLHAGSLCGFGVSCWITLLLSLLSKWPPPLRYPPFFFFLIFASALKRIKHYFFWLNKCIPPQIQKDPSVGESYVFFFSFLYFSPKHCQSWFPPRLLKRDSIKGNRKLCISNTVPKISEEIDEGGTHSCTKSLLIFRNKQWRLLDALFIPPFSLMAYS